jgi:hypothetical protein
MSYLKWESRDHAAGDIMVLAYPLGMPDLASDLSGIIYVFLQPLTRYVSYLPLSLSHTHLPLFSVSFTIHLLDHVVGEKNMGTLNVH